MLQVLLEVGKWVGIISATYIIYLVYQLVVTPYLAWKKYQKFPNVHTAPDFVPLLGEIKVCIDDNKNGRAHYANKIKSAPQMKDYDLRLKLEGYTPVIMLHSNKAVEEFCRLQPHKIDRFNSQKALSKMGTGAFIFERSTKKTIARKKLLTGFLSFNSSSRHIPAMVKYTKEVVDNLKDGSTHDFIDVANVLSFNIFTSVLFGGDMIELAEKLRPYQMPGGKVDHLNMRDFMIRLFKAYFHQFFHPITITLKFLMHYNLVNPFKRDRENFLTYMEGMKELYSNCKDEESICKQILEKTDFEDAEKIMDLNGFILAGAETSSHAIVSTLYFLKKYPEKLEKLLEEFRENDITADLINSGGLTREVVEQLDYLSCVIKETLRVDNPAHEPFQYITLDDVNI